LPAPRGLKTSSDCALKRSRGQAPQPNIVQVYEVSEHEGFPFFSLEYVEGGTLTRKADGKPLPPRQAAK